MHSKDKCCICCCCPYDKGFNRLWNTYDRTYLISVILQYFNGGTRLALRLGIQYLLQTKLGQDPQEAQYYLAIMNIPWAPKLFYGILADTFALCGSRKKNWLILFSII